MQRQFNMFALKPFFTRITLVITLGRSAIYHMMIGILFNLPHFIYINFMSYIRGMDGYIFWCYYPFFISRIMQHQGVLNHLMLPSTSVLVRNVILVNSAVISHKFNIGNNKQMNLEVNKLNKVPLCKQKG